MFGGALQDYYVQLLDSPRDVRHSAQRRGYFIEALVERGGSFEIEGAACGFTFARELFGERGAGGFERLENAADFHVVFLFGASGEARRETHLHFRIHAAGIIGIAADFYLAAARLEKVEKAVAEVFGKAARRKGTEVEAFVGANSPGDIAARVSIAQIYFEHGGRTQAHQVAISARKVEAGVFVVGEGLLEFGAGDAIADTPGYFAEVQRFR